MKLTFANLFRKNKCILTLLREKGAFSVILYIKEPLSFRIVSSTVPSEEIAEIICIDFIPSISKIVFFIFPFTFFASISPAICDSINSRPSLFALSLDFFKTSFFSFKSFSISSSTIISIEKLLVSFS
ncbi:hypothetical protein D3C81_1313150 [compost metagenome]